jgi:MoxR-like ATPase
MNTNYNEKLRKERIIWFGKLNATTDVIVIYRKYKDNTPATIVPMAFTKAGSKLSCIGTEETKGIKQDFLDILKVVYDDKKLTIKQFTETSKEDFLEDFPKIESDYNDYLFSKDIKYLRESKQPGKFNIKQALEDFGFDVSDYTFTVCKHSVDFELLTSPLVVGKDNWTAEQIKYAYDFSEHEDKSLQHPQLLTKLLNGSCKFFFFTGEAGCGKTVEAQLMAQKGEFPAIPVDFSSIDNAKLFGTLLPKSEGMEIDVNNPATFIVVPGPLYYAYKYGLVILGDEFLSAEVTIQNNILSIADPNVHTYTFYWGETVERHPNFGMILTGNVGYSGNKDLNVAVADRFLHKAFRAPSRERLIEMLSKCELYDATGFPKLIEAVVDNYILLKNYYKNNNFRVAFSVRAMKNYIHSCLVARQNNVAVDFDTFAACWVDVTSATGDVLEDSELDELYNMTKPYYEGINEIVTMKTEDDDDEDEPEGITLLDLYNPDDLDNQLNDFAEEAGIEMTEEE